jgi:hypothetical protein
MQTSKNKRITGTKNTGHGQKTKFLTKENKFVLNCRIF